MISLNFTYSDTLNEYINLLVSLLCPHIYDGVMSIYSTGKKSTDEKNHLISFQQLLKATKSWSSETKEYEYQRIKESSGCLFFDKLIKAVLISNTRVLVGNSNKNLKDILSIIDISPANFVFKCYLEVARKLYTQPSLIVGNKDNFEKQKDMAIFLELIKNSIHTAVRNSLPLETLIDNYLVDDVPEKNERAISQMSEQFQSYLTGYMEEVNKRISEDVKKIIHENNSANKIKMIDLSPTGSPQINRENDMQNDMQNDVNNSPRSISQSLEDSPMTTISLNNIDTENNAKYDEIPDINDEIDISDLENNNTVDVNIVQDVNNLSCDEVLISEQGGGGELNENDNEIEVLDNVNLEGGSNNIDYSDSDERRTIELTGIKGSKKFMTRRERDQLRTPSNNFSFFDS